MVLAARLVADEPRPDEPRVIERFEGVEPSWSLRSVAQGIGVVKHIRTNEQRRTGNQSEFIHLKTIHRTGARLVHALPKAQVINDYCPFIWIQSNQSAIKLGVRVVLPRTENPVGSGPLQVIVELDQTDSTDQWERLGCGPGDLRTKLNGRLRSIQFQFQELKIDTTDAYCDLLVLSGLDQPHTEYKIWLDDLSQVGFLPARHHGEEIADDAMESNRGHLVRIRDGCLRVHEKPFFLRAVEHNGESFAFLKQLGFNGVVLDRHPTTVELEQAQQYQVWIICPPLVPRQLATEPLLESKNLEMILAWDFGSHLTTRELDSSRRRHDLLDETRGVIDRPVIGHAHFPQAEYARLLDLRRLTHLTAGTAFGLDAFRRYLRTEGAGLDPVMVDIQTELPPVILDQARLLPRPTGRGLLSRGQILRLTFEALSSGARGLVFQSSANLEQDTPRSQWLAPIFRSINRELIQVEPWIAGGLTKTLTASAFDAVSFQLPRSQLTLVYRQRQPEVQKRNPTLQLETSQQAPRVYAVTETGMVPMLHHSRVGRLDLELSRDPGWHRFVVSEDQLSFEYIHQATQSFASDGGILNDKYLVSRNAYDRVRELIDAVSEARFSSPVLFASLAELDKNLTVCRTFLDRGQSTTAQALVARIEDRLEVLTASLTQEMVASRELISSPFNTDFGQLANYITLEKLLKHRRWSENLLPSGAFESLERMADAGWSQHLNSSGQVQATVSLRGTSQPVGTEPQTNTRALVIQTWRGGEAPDEPISVTPVWLSSPVIRVQPQQVIRVEGYIQIEHPISHSLDGFMILDSIGGPELGCRFSRTDGWRYFALERIVPRAMDFQLILAQTGLGQVRLANLQIRVCDLNEAVAQKSTSDTIQ